VTGQAAEEVEYILDLAEHTVKEKISVEHKTSWLNTEKVIDV